MNKPSQKCFREMCKGSSINDVTQFWTISKPLNSQTDVSKNNKLKLKTLKNYDVFFLTDPIES